MITIVDYGMGNIASLRKMFAKLKVATELAGDPGSIAAARKLLLPGVGHFGAAMEELKRRDLIGALNDQVARGTPVLGVCLGMQLLSGFSEEGDAEGLNWIPGRTIRFRFPPGTSRPIPNMGWRQLRLHGDDAVVGAPGEGARYYFVHSYHVACDEPAHVVGSAEYGIPYAAAIRRGNVLGVQFHPEKSHKFGMGLLAAFAAG